MPKIIHDRQVILAYIVRYKQNHDGVAPSFEEIMNATSIRSKSLMCYILRQLEEAGQIQMIPGQARSIQIVGGYERSVYAV